MTSRDPNIVYCSGKEQYKLFFWSFGTLECLCTQVHQTLCTLECTHRERSNWCFGTHLIHFTARTWKLWFRTQKEAKFLLLFLSKSSLFLEDGEVFPPDTWILQFRLQLSSTVSITVLSFLLPADPLRLWVIWNTREETLLPHPAFSWS